MYELYVTKELLQHKTHTKMKNKIRNTLRALLAAGAMAIMPMAAHAQEPSGNPKVRERLDLVQTDDNRATQFSLGVALDGQSKHAEFLRVFDYETQVNGVDSHYTAAGLVLPDIKFDDSKLGTRVYGCTGDKEGEGISLKATSGPVILAANAERVNLKEGEFLDMLGTGADVKFNDLTFRLGYDKQSGRENSDEFFTAALLYDASKTSLYGAAYQHGNSGEKDLHTIVLTANNYDPSSFSHRTRVKADLDGDSKTFNLNSIVTPRNTTLSRIACEWFASRDHDAGGLLNKSIVQDPLWALPTLLQDRVTSGFVGELDATYSIKDGIDSFSPKASIGYVLADVAGAKVGLVGCDKYTFTESHSNDTNSVGANILVRKSVGRFTGDIFAGVDKTTSGNAPHPTYTIGLEARF